MMGTMHSDQTVDCEGTDAGMEHHGGSSNQTDCSGGGSGECCMSCVACALPKTFPLYLETVSHSFKGQTFGRPQIHLKSELQPPRTHSS